MVINIQDDILKLHALGLLDRLLRDKASKGNILWATDAYSRFGDWYSPGNEIRPQRITGDYSDLIKTRARRAMEQRTERTRQHAEVFTPLWVVKKMNDFADEQWFRRKSGFYLTDREGHVRFPKKRTWKQYVDARRLEITCGEAPFLVTRYDVETGEALPVEERIGLLDRKLRVASENAIDLAEWKTWALRAVQSTYGYELQGDNLLIARVNVLCSVEEHMLHRWKRKPEKTWLEKLCNVSCWNLWQMDGLKGCVPVPPQPTEEQLCLFAAEPLYERENLFGETKETKIGCRLFDWRGDHSLSYQALREKGPELMKFDFIIGNPPYQEETENNGRQNPIYHLFMDESYLLAPCVELITPARFLFNAGQTPKAWNNKMLNDKHIKVIFFNPDPKGVFSNTEIKGGVAVTIRNIAREYEPIQVFTKYPELNRIMVSVRKVHNGMYLDNIVSPRGTYRLTDKFFTELPDASKRLGKGTGNMIASNFFEQIPEAWTDCPEKAENYYGILCRVKNRRKYCYILREYIRPNNYIAGYNVASPKSNGNGIFGETLTTTEIVKPNCGTADSFISIGSFKSLSEAEALTKYIKTKFLRALLGIKKVTQDNSKGVWNMIPLQDFTPASDIDWSKSIPEIDRQLYAKYGLDAAEIEFIETHVKEMT